MTINKITTIKKLLTVGLVAFSFSSFAEPTLFSTNNIAECKSIENKLWSCIPESADIEIDGELMRESSPDLVECKGGVCKTYEGKPAGHAKQDGKYYIFYDWQLILDGKYAAYPTQLPVTDENSIPEPTFPAVAAFQDELRFFIPWGWSVLHHATGHLDNDGKADHAFILQADNVQFRVKNEESNSESDDGNGELDLNPRMLLVLLSNGETGYRKLVQNNQFIPSAQRFMSEPVELMKIENGLLKLNFSVFMTSGSWTTSNDEFVFGYNNESMFLFNYTHTEIHRGSGEMNTVTVDYTKGITQTAEGTIESDESKVTTNPIKFNVSPNLNSIFVPAIEFYGMYYNWF